MNSEIQQSPELLPPHGCPLQTDTWSEFPIQGVPSPTGDGFVHVLLLFLSPPLQDFEQKLQDNHADQPPFTGIKFTFSMNARNITTHQAFYSIPSFIFHCHLI